MSFFSKMFVMGMCGVGMMLASASDSEAGCRHRHRRGHHGGGCHSAPASTCGQAYAAPVSNGCCTTNGVVYGEAPQMAPAGSYNTSPSDLPSSPQPPAPPAPAPGT